MDCQELNKEAGVMYLARNCWNLQSLAFNVRTMSGLARLDLDPLY